MRHVVLISAPWRDPVWAAAPWRDEPFACAMISGGQAGRWSYLLREPDATLAVGPEDPATRSPPWPN